METYNDYYYDYEIVLALCLVMGLAIDSRL
jgi:hypothetical protein